jgi:Predicted xylanase/chitin deacetylase
MKNKVLISTVLCMLMIFSINIFADDISKAHNWYVKRAPNNERPTADTNMTFITDYNAYYIGNNPDDKVLYLTFDAGYENGNIETILNVLKKHKVQGSFFVLENLIKSNPDLIKRMAEEDHLVCNHTMKHFDMSKIRSKEKFTEELKSLADLYKNCTGYDMPKFYRPPEGRFSEENLMFAKEIGYKTIFWSFAYADWDNKKQPDPEEAKLKILSNTHNGAVILLHPTSGTNAAILDDLITEWKNQGYRFGNLYQLTRNSM